MSNSSTYYEERLSILQKIHEIRDIITKHPKKPNVSGEMDMIYKCLRDGLLHKDSKYKDLCMVLVLNHILNIDEKYDLSKNTRLRYACQTFAEDIEKMGSEAANLKYILNFKEGSE